MASDLDTVRVLRALFNDMPRAPQGLSHQETMAWIERSMQDFEGGEMAYTIEHITRNSMLDIVLRMREEGQLRDDAAFDETVALISTPEGRKTFMDRCITAQKSVDATSRLINRAKRSWSDPRPFFDVRLDEVQRFVRGEPSGPGPLVAEFLAREDVQGVGVGDLMPERIFEFSWGFVTEDAGVWHVYVAEAWRRGTVGYFERFPAAWRMEIETPGDSEAGAHPVPAGLSFDVGITAFSCLCLQAGPAPVEDSTRQWLGEVFLARMLPYMAGRALDDDYDFPLPQPEH